MRLKTKAEIRLPRRTPEVEAPLLLEIRSRSKNSTQPPYRQTPHSSFGSSLGLPSAAATLFTPCPSINGAVKREQLALRLQFSPGNQAMCS